ncbi:DNA/RNA non-specific endonuclease [Novosphingobium taihuense]|uniref:Endonuclease G n=1 Tax=Novosphingobium taihuense TaxID=260085 RepID=A0A7W7EVE4_9SPHN|nr:DNA/RNA non-specific endonuclease [Novosphingobium taihuense]MBB4615378.1 endonuclease G [Novosphingobium taihuense]TWH82171.1 endonuclease G [Novosphingobium taihuense]
MDEVDVEALRVAMTPDMVEAIRAKAQRGTLPPAAMAGLSRAAIEAIATDVAPLESVVPLAALEAIVQLTGRPPLLVRNGSIVMEPLTDLPGADALVIGTEALLPSVGRVEFRNYDMAWGGTGWVVAHDGADLLVVTNRHVAKLVARRTFDGSGVFMRSPAGPLYGSSIDFGEEVTSVIGDTSRTVKVTSIDYIADDLEADVALLRVGAPALTPTPLDLADREAAYGDLVALIGYPAYDSRNDAAAQSRYFRDLYDVKRVAPGRVTQALGGDSLLSHDCTSLGGNSGSPLIALADRKVVGLHFAGLYGKRNSAVGVGTLKKLLAGERLLAVVPKMPAERADGIHPATYFTDREGFATRDFLGGVATPWPKLSSEAADGLSQPSDAPTEPGEIRYTHFGVKYSGRLKMPVMTAVNIDGKNAVRIKRSGDQWFADERVPLDVQLVAKNFKDIEIDRGHMVRREDPNWGPDAKKANFDTFHYVNAVAQHSRLNQGKQLWQGLENYILDSARTAGFRVCVFTGPVLTDGMESIDGALVPREFWKLIAAVNQETGGLHATAYLLSQGELIRALLEKRSRSEANEGLNLGAYRTFQIAIADLADATGHDFSAYAAADPLRRITEGLADGAPPTFTPLEGLNSITL